MSLQFSDTTNLRGLVQEYEREIGANPGDISGNTTKLKQFTASANNSLDDYIALAIQCSGTWKADDSNHTDFPEILTNIESGQREYTFLTDENGNAILDVYKVYARESTTAPYKLLKSYDSDSETEASTFTDGMGVTGFAYSYDKTSNVIRLNVVPSTTITNGLKVSINREGSYFTYADTNKKPGFPGLHHKYFYLKPALDYARRNNLASYLRIEAEVMKLEREIKEYFDRRAKDEPQKLTVFKQNNR